VVNEHFAFVQARRNVQIGTVELYDLEMEVPVTEFRAQLRDWVDRARAGEEITITDRGIPVARLIGVASAPMLERLVNDGVISPPMRTQRPQAGDRRRVRARGAVSDLIAEQRLT
jgi:prevent-host-death family protein